MLGVIDKDKEYEILHGYFDMLSRMGYVKSCAVERLLMWLFIVDFAEMMKVKISEKDYKLINDALISLFSNGCCLMPYSYFAEESLTTNSVEPWQLLGR